MAIARVSVNPNPVFHSKPYNIIVTNWEDRIGSSDYVKLVWMHHDDRGNWIGEFKWIQTIDLTDLNNESMFKKLSDGVYSAYDKSSIFGAIIIDYNTKTITFQNVTKENIIQTGNRPDNKVRIEVSTRAGGYQSAVEYNVIESPATTNTTVDVNSGAVITETVVATPLGNIVVENSYTTPDGKIIYDTQGTIDKVQNLITIDPDITAEDTTLIKVDATNGEHTQAGEVVKIGQTSQVTASGNTQSASHGDPIPTLDKLKNMVKDHKDRIVIGVIVVGIVASVIFIATPAGKKVIKKVG